ncbi:hypothetical protein BJY04DRAFT_224699 [Aspergillus karnatakaensis]|uniref:uncharacterized protein n=1 Tax=Aspergillus karnatakaensis TaxID=1810916 RepID=UPI003CCD741A
MAHPHYPPDDILHLILQHIYNDRPKAPIPFWDLAEWCKDATQSQTSSRRTRTLKSLMLTSRHLHSLVNPLFYRNVLVRKWSVERQLHLTWKFYQSLKHNPELASYLHSAIINCSNFDPYNPQIPVFAGGYQAVHYGHLDPNGTTNLDLSNLLTTLFCSPNIQTLTLVEFKAWDAFQFTGTGTSLISTLSLMHCGAKEPALSSILSYPSTLKTLHYNANQGAWGMHYENQPEEEWTCAAFVRSLQSQKHCLEELTLTREYPDHEGLCQGPRLDVSDFPALKILRLFHLFLVGLEDHADAWRGLPMGLEELEVYYDDTGMWPDDIWSERSYDDDNEEDEDTESEPESEHPHYSEAAENWLRTVQVTVNPEWAGSDWLRSLLRQRQAGKFPGLKVVKVYTPEQVPVLVRGQKRDETTRLWALPEAVMELAREGGVEVEVWVGLEESSGSRGYDALDLL